MYMHMYVRLSLLLHNSLQARLLQFIFMSKPSFLWYSTYHILPFADFASPPPLSCFLPARLSSVHATFSPLLQLDLIASDFPLSQAAYAQYFSLLVACCLCRRHRHNHHHHQQAAPSHHGTISSSLHLLHHHIHNLTSTSPSNRP